MPSVTCPLLGPPVATESTCFGSVLGALLTIALLVLGALVFRWWFGPLRGRPTVSSKINTAMQLLYPMAMLVHAALSFPPREVLDALAILVFSTTVFSGLNYMAIFTRRAWAQPVGPS